MSVNSPAARVQRIREWRDRFHPSDSRVSAAHWHDVNLLLSQLAQAEAIVRDLAASPTPGYPHPDAPLICELCDGQDTHAESCPWRRAREWCDTHPLNPGGDDE